MEVPLELVVVPLQGVLAAAQLAVRLVAPAQAELLAVDPSPAPLAPVAALQLVMAAVLAVQ